MWNETTDGKHAIEKWSKEIVSRVAPEEMDIFDELLEEHLSDPHPPELKPTSSDDPLGFGVGDVLAAATPAAAAITNSTISILLSIIPSNSRQEALSLISKRRTDQLTVDSRRRTERLALSQDEFVRIHEAALQTATLYGMNEAKARDMANALIVTIMLAPIDIAGPMNSVKILFLAANPVDTQHLRLGEEIRTIQNNLRQSDAGHRFHVEQAWAVRVSDLQDLLLTHQPDVVHFSGHGSLSGEIILEDEQGCSQPVSPSAFGKTFGPLRQRMNIRCVMLNACNSERQAESIAEHVDCVIGMPDMIEDALAIAFARSFYRALIYGFDIQSAYLLGVNEIELNAPNYNKTPRLLVRSNVVADQVFL